MEMAIDKGVFTEADMGSIVSAKLAPSGASYLTMFFFIWGIFWSCYWVFSLIYGLAKDWDQRQLAFHLAMSITTLILMGLVYLRFILPDTIIVKNAINKLSSIKKDKFKKYLILGDMLELGLKSKKYHEQLSKVINNSDIDKVFVKGKKTIFTYKQLNKDKRGNILQNNEDIDISLRGMISNNDHLMIKGSNATGLNDFSKKMIKGI